MELNADSPFATALFIWSFQDRDGSSHTPRTLSDCTLSASWFPMVTVDRRSSVTLFFLVKWITWYFSGAKTAPNLFAHATHLSCALDNLRQFAAAESPHVTNVVSSMNPKPRTSPVTSLNCSSRSAMKMMKSAGESVDPCGIPVSVSNQRLV